MYNSSHDATHHHPKSTMSESNTFDFNLSSIAAFVEEQVIPLEPLLLKQQWAELEKALDDIRKKVKHHNWWSTLPTNKALTMQQMGLLSEVVGRSPLGHFAFGFQAPDIGNMELLHQHAAPSIKSKWLTPLQLGEIRSCFAMTEPDNPGSNPTMLSTQAQRDGDHWVINGRKWFTTSADGAAFTIVMAITDPDAPKHQRASMILVPCDNIGFQVKRNISVMGHQGKGYFSHSEVVFDDCRVPLDHLIGETGQGFKLAQDRLGPGRIHHCMRWLGVAQRCFDTMCQHIKQRPITDTQTLADQPLMQAKVAESYTAMASARAMVINTAAQIDQSSFQSARHDISMIKFYCADMLKTVIDNALQALGALGMTDETIVSFYHREERAAAIYDGPNEVHMLSLAKNILKAY